MRVLAESGQSVRGDSDVTSISFARAERRTGFPPRSRGDSERTYRRAIRHSRHVRWLRAGLLGAIALVLLAVVADNYLPIGGLRLPGEIGRLVIQGTVITMQQPHLTGFTSDQRPYEFTADSAQQDITKPDFANLQRIRAKIAMADKSMVHLSADNGVYNMKTDMLTLNENIRLVSSTGYEARLSQASIDMNKGTVVSNTPVWVKLLDGDLNAKALEIVDKGDVLRFSDVTLVLQSGKQDAKAAKP
jgi:lipopolysaccharide export system protein LptC